MKRWQSYFLGLWMVWLGYLLPGIAAAQTYSIPGASVSATTAAQGQTVNFSGTVLSTGTVSGKNIYFEIFDGTTKVANKEFANQSLTANVSRTFTWAFVVPMTMAPKSYTLKFVVYNSDWSVLHTWRSLGNLTVTTPTTLTFNVTSLSFSPTSATSGQTVTANAALTSSLNATGINVHFELFDGNVKVANKDILTQTFSAGVSRSFNWAYVVPSTLAPKSYTMKLAVYNSNWTVLYAAPTIGTLTVTGAAVGRVVPPEFFGMHMGAPTAEPWPIIEFKSYRTWDAWPLVSWIDIQPSRGTFDWSLLDNLINTVGARGVNITYTFGYTPAWASTNPTGDCNGAPKGSCYAPRDADWQTFVSAITARYKGRIHNYEIWNEPNAGNFYKGSYAQLANMERIAAPYIRGAGAKVLTPCPQGPAAYVYLDGYFGAGGGTNADVVTFHSYLEGAPPEALITLVTEIRAKMAKYNLSAKPLWDTEHSWGTPLDTFGKTQDLQAAYVARLLPLSFSQNIQRTYWYMWDSIGATLYGNLFNRSTKVIQKPGIAHREVQKWMVNATMFPCTNSGSVYQCRLTRAGGYEGRIVWNTSASSSFTAPSGFTRYKTLTGATVTISGSSVPIGIQPVIIEKPGI